MAGVLQFSDSKRRLLEAYIRGEAERQSKQSAILPRDPGAPVPLAPSQQQIWFHSQMAPHLPVYNEPITIHYRGELNRSVLKRAFAEILRRHEAWRTVFSNVDGKVLQVVREPFELDIPFHDLTQWGAAQCEGEALRLATADAKKAFDLDTGPMLRARLLKMAPDHHRLHLTLHHIIFDGVAIYRTLVPELSVIYDAFARGKASPLPEPKLQFADYALWQEKMLSTASATRQIEYWRRQL